MSLQDRDVTYGDHDIAIVGMAARLPGASDIASYWRNLRDGVASIRQLTEDELIAAGEDPGLMRHKNYVPFAAPLDHFKEFDADFFGLSPKEAAIMDPQHRQFLETAWEAFETAGHVPERFDGPIGVFGGCGMGSYFYFNVCSNPDLVDETGMFLLRHTGNDKDFMTTRLSHILDLHGPSVNLQTACSTSLVATHYAAQALLNGECDMALAGGVTIELPHARGYLYKENEILSPDGECHAFDHRAQGTVFGSGVGVVVLRRLQDAIDDGDHIWAVIKGTAVNNDGAAKAGYLAPSVDGQAQAIAEAQAIAGITADKVDYVECHGTGTYLGDPIEVAALTQAFRETTGDTAYCRIGSVKTNIGHLDTAAGVASLIKTSLALHHKQMPPSLGYEAPNPAIDFEASPFRVNDSLTDWRPRAGLRIAGVNSLGVGGTNAHAVLAEAPPRAASDDSDWPFQILTVSGRSKAALDANAKNLAAHLRAHPEQSLADVAWTLHAGRRAFEKRRVIVAESHDEAARLLEEDNPRRVHSHSALSNPDIVFMFPGGGAQYAGMARDLYETEPVFAEWIDRGLDVLQPKIEYDIRALWLPERGQEAEADRRLMQPSVQLPLIMIVEYALAQLWQSWGIEPAALTGHSMGENTAACVAGVMRFEDCIGLVHLRGQLMDRVPAGGMLSVPLSRHELEPLLGDDLDLGAINAPELCVATGPQAALDRLGADLAARGVECQRIPIDIAAHSRLLDSILSEFGDYLRSIPLSAPQFPLTSNRTGQLMTEAQATDPEYWVEHLRGTVHFADCIGTLARDNRIFLEVGPGKALSALTRQHGAVPGQQVLSSLRHPDEVVEDDRYLLEVLGRIWALGGEFDWEQIWGDAARHRVVLPTYAFQHAEYFIEPGTARAEQSPRFLMRNEDVSEWGWKPVWRPRAAEVVVDVRDGLSDAPRETWLMFMDDAGVADKAARRLRDAGHEVVEVRPGDTFARTGETGYVIAPERGREGYDLLLRDVAARGVLPTRIAHFWLVTRDDSHRPGSSFFHRVQEQGFYSLLFLAQALAEEDLPGALHVSVFTNGAERLRDEALPYPSKSTITGPVRVIPHELPGITVSLCDLEVPMAEAASFWKASVARRAQEQRNAALADRVLEELLAAPGCSQSALRGDRRLERSMQSVALTAGAAPFLEPGKTCLITGGFGGIGQTLAKEMAGRGVNLVLVARGDLPRRSDWRDYLLRHAPQDRIARRIRMVQELETLGARVMVCAADVCNMSQMQAVVDRAREEFGAIDAVIHGAGVIDDGPLLAKSPAGIEDVFTPKIHGTEVLDQLFPDGALEWMALFSSSSTVIAPAGQVDYVAANEYLNVFARARAGGKTRVVAINWGVWSDVGMAAEAVAERTGDLPRPPVDDADVPLLQQATFDDEGNRIFTAEFSQDDWIIDEHRLADGTALMPGTGFVELAAQALRAHGETGEFEIRDLAFLRPLVVPEGVARRVRLRLRRSDQGYRFELLSDMRHDNREGYVLCAQADISLIGLIPPAVLDINGLDARLPSPQAAAEGQHLPTAQEAHLAFGPRWRTLRSCATGVGEGLARLSLPPDAAGDQGFVLHPALLDIATGWAMNLIDGYVPDALWVPVSYERIRVYRPLGRDIISRVRNGARNQAGSETARFDITLAGPDGTVMAEIDGFTIRRLDDVSVLTATPRVTAAEMEWDDGADAATQPLSPAEERLQHNISQGIKPGDGADAFARAMSLGEPQIVVSSLDLDGLAAQAGQVEESNQSQKFDRPQLDGDYVAPDGPIEERLAGFWEDLLGVQNVGVEDSFFDLGGHSLIAVRLFAMVKKAFGVDFPISVLFEAPTIRKCAALVAERTGPADEKAEGQAAPKVPDRRFKHLVAMHGGEGGPRTPFFLVAGMFGNVLNLRHLAHLLGSDRPFYGLQARGLYGDESPHDTIEETARDYIAEMRQVQPEGPYLLGGFSGGGITAYEIAHQLEAMGQQVALVVLLDTPLPQRRPLEWRDRLLIQLQELRRKGLTYPVTWARNRIAWELAKRRAPEAGTENTGSFHNAEIEAAFLRAVAQYQMRDWDGRLVLFRPPQLAHWTVSGGRKVDDQRAYLLDDNDWGQFVPDVEVHEVPGDHDSMVLEPNVRVLAAQMREAIERAESHDQPADVLTFQPAKAAG